MSCLIKVGRPCCLFKMCEARVNSGIVSFSVVSQCVSCNSMAVTLLVCASCSMMVNLELVSHGSQIRPQLSAASPTNRP